MTDTAILELIRKDFWGARIINLNKKMLINPFIDPSTVYYTR